MAKSKTKYQATDEQLVALMAKHGIEGVLEISSLGDGEFNAAYCVKTEERDYVVKISPKAGATVLSYEQGMMRSEVFWYEKMTEHTDIRIPKVYASDFSREDIEADYFIMERIDGKPLWAVELGEEEAAAVQEQKIGMLAKIHRIEGERFGYEQSGLKRTWYEGIRAMAEALIADCKALGYKTPDGERFLADIDRHKALLERVPCRMVNFDLWDSNILYCDGQLCWIDPERSFWGDPVADFITLGKGQKTPLSEKMKEIEIYNRTAETKLSASGGECIRYAVAVAYLALIEEVERYVRYEPDEPNYIRNTVDARAMYDMAFAILEQE